MFYAPAHLQYTAPILAGKQFEFDFVEPKEAYCMYYMETVCISVTYILLSTVVLTIRSLACDSPPEPAHWSKTRQYQVEDEEEKWVRIAVASAENSAG